MIAALLVLVVTTSGCAKDTDCKGDRVCEDGRCVSPATLQPPPVVQPAPAPAPEPAQPPELVPEDPYADPFNQPQSTPPDPSAPPVPGPSTPQYPRTVYERGYVCREFLDAAGAVRRECHRDARSNRRESRELKREAKERRRERREQAREEVREREGPPLRPVGNLVAHGGILVATPSVRGLFGASGSAGVMFRPGIGVVGVANVQLVPNGEFGIAQLYSLGPAVRFGHKSHVLLGVAPTFGVVPATTVTPPTTGFLWSVFAQGALVLADHFTLMLQPMLSVDLSGVIFTVSGGAGWQF